jgi:hypothetical protein
VEVAVRQEFQRVGIQTRNADRAGFTFREMAYLLKLREIIGIRKGDT